MEIYMFLHDTKFYSNILKLSLGLFLLPLNLSASPTHNLQELRPVPIPLADLNALKTFVVGNQGNLPEVFGSRLIQSVPLDKAFASNGFKNFPLKLVCSYNANCNAALQIGAASNGLYKVKATDTKTNNFIETTIKLTDLNDNPIDVSDQSFTIERILDNELIRPGNYISLIPEFIYGSNAPISYINLPIVKNSYYQICDGSGNNCTNKKALFDSNLSGNTIHYLSFWKLERQDFLSPFTAKTYTYTFTAGVTNTSSTAWSFSLGSKTPPSISELNFGLTYNTSTSIATQLSKSISISTYYSQQNEQSTIGLYVLYAGVYDDIPILNNLVQDLNSYINNQQNNNEFKFLVANRYNDSKANTQFKNISMGSAIFRQDDDKITDGSDLYTWSVSAPTY